MRALSSVGKATLVILTATAVQAANVFWSGAVNGNWSNGGNWAGGTPPASASDNVYLENAGSPPTNQDIPNLAIGILVISNFNGLAIGGQDLTLKYVVDRYLTTTRTNWLNCNLKMSENSAWQIGDGKARIIVNGGLGEVGTRNLSANYGGVIELRGTNTHSDGFKNNQATIVFYGTNNLGTVPSTLDDNFFEGGYGAWTFATTGGFSRIVVPSTCGLKTTNGQGLNALQDVKLVIHAPIGGTGGLNQDWASTGRRILKGANTLTGSVSCNAGTTVLGNSSGLGPGAAGKTVSMVGTLDLNGYDLTSRDLQFVNGWGDQSSGELKNNDTTRAATVSGNVNLGSGGGGSLQFGGNGDIILPGIVGPASSAYMLRKTGDGTLTLKGANIHNSATGIEAGGLTLDYTAQNNSKLNDAQTFYLSQATARFVGNSAAASTEMVGALGIGTQVNIASGASSVTLEPGANQDLTLVASNIVIQGASTVDFSVVPNGSGTASLVTTNAAGILAGASATWNRSTWAKVAGGVVTGMADGEYFTAFGNNASNAHVDVPAGATTVGVTDTEQTLRFKASAGSTLTIANSVTLRLHGLNGSAAALRPGILVTPSASAVTIASDGTGAIDPGLNQVLFIHQYSASPLTVSARIGGAGAGNSIVKTGPGEVILTATNNTMGGVDGTRIFGGTLTVNNLKDTGTSCSLGTDDTIVLANATLKYTGTGDAHNRYIALRGPATLDASGSGPWVFSNGTTVRRAASWDNNLTLTGSGCGALLGTIDLLFGGLVKEGNGTWTVCGTQPYLGDTTVNAGTLVLSNQCVLARSVIVGANGTLAGAATIGEDLALNGTWQATMRGDGDFDRLTVRYDATVGEVRIVTAPGYKPPAGQDFTVLTAGGTISGTVSSADPRFEVRQVGNSLVARYLARGLVILVR